jgi:uncharacterized membrane protein
MRAMDTALLVLHFLGLALGVGAGFAQVTLWLVARSLAPQDRNLFGLRALELSRNSSYGLLLLILSGAGMLAIRGVSATFQQGGPAFHAKLTLVGLMLGVFGYVQVLIGGAKRKGGGPGLTKIRVLGQLVLLLGVLVVICATLAFH